MEEANQSLNVLTHVEPTKLSINIIFQKTFEGYSRTMEETKKLKRSLAKKEGKKLFLLNIIREERSLAQIYFLLKPFHSSEISNVQPTINRLSNVWSNDHYIPLFQSTNLVNKWQ